MKHSLFPNGVVVDQDALTSESQAKADAILQRHKDTSTMGIVSGLGISVGSTASRIKINPVNGYTPNGEYIQIDDAIDNQVIPSVSAGTKLYVLAIYTETEGTPQANDDTGATVNTVATSTYRIAIYTEAEYNDGVTLPETDSDLSHNAKDRALLLGIVTSVGPGGTLSANNIANAAPFNAIIGIANQPVNIIGVSVTGVDNNTIAGNGILTYTPGSVSIKWRAPGESVDGPSVNIGTVGEETPYTLFSDGGRSIFIRVTSNKLPLGNSDVVDVITIFDIYTQNTSHFTARDEHHRHLLGSGTPSLKNPHGLTIDDLGGTNADTLGALAIHRLEQHPSMFGINNSAGGGAASIDTSPSPDTILISSLVAQDYVFVGGNVITTITVPSGGAVVPNIPANANPGLLEVYIDERGSVQFSRRVDTGSHVDPTSGSSGFLRVIDISPHWIGSASAITFLYDTANGGQISLAGKTPVRLSTLAGGNPGVMRVYANNINSLWLDLMVYPSLKPLQNVTETWNISDPVDPTRRKMLVIATVAWTGNADGNLGYGASSPTGTPRTLVDKRFPNFSTGRPGAPGARIAVDARRRTGILALSMDNKGDAIIDRDTLALLIGTDSGPVIADSLHTHTPPPDQPSIMTAEEVRVLVNRDATGPHPADNLHTHAAASIGVGGTSAVRTGADVKSQLEELESAIVTGLAPKIPLSGGTFTGPVTFNDTVQVNSPFNSYGVIAARGGMQVDDGAGRGGIFFGGSAGKFIEWDGTKWRMAGGAQGMLTVDDKQVPTVDVRVKGGSTYVQIAPVPFASGQRFTMVDAAVSCPDPNGCTILGYLVGELSTNTGNGPATVNIYLDAGGADLVNQDFTCPDGGYFIVYLAMEAQVYSGGNFTAHMTYQTNHTSSWLWASAAIWVQ